MALTRSIPWSKHSASQTTTIKQRPRHCPSPYPTSCCAPFSSMSSSTNARFRELASQSMLLICVQTYLADSGASWTFYLSYSIVDSMPRKFTLKSPLMKRPTRWRESVSCGYKSVLQLHYSNLQNAGSSALVANQGSWSAIGTK